MPHESRYPLETIEKARALYRDGARVRDISAATGMSVGALYYHLDGHSLPGLAPARLPRRREVEGNAAAPMPRADARSSLPGSFARRRSRRKSSHGRSPGIFSAKRTARSTSPRSAS